MTAQKISITKSMNEPREIDNLQITVWFQINGQTYFDYESQGTFNNIQTDPDRRGRHMERKSVDR
jgi:hypothetical protein